jgi:hypothetical protein
LLGVYAPKLAHVQFADSLSASLKDIIHHEGHLGRSGRLNTKEMTGKYYDVIPAISELSRVWAKRDIHIRFAAMMKSLRCL